MVTIKDIAKIVASQHNIKVAEAEEFVQKLVDTINEGLETDRLVKIKGFGTFKMQAMKSRASVNVNTGERVIIGEHDRITFLPDAMMKNPTKARAPARGSRPRSKWKSGEPWRLSKESCSR